MCHPRYTPMPLDIANDIRAWGKAYAFHKCCRYWNPIYAGYMVWVATKVNAHRHATRFTLM